MYIASCRVLGLGTLGFADALKVLSEFTLLTPKGRPWGPKTVQYEALYNSQVLVKRCP